MRIQKIKTSNKIHLYSISLIILLGLSVYINSVSGPFIWDDEALINNNYFIKDLRYIGDIFKRNLAFASGTPSIFYRPMQNLSYMLDFHLFGTKAWGFRLTNIILHILNSILIYFIILRFTKVKHLAFLASLLFVVHPVHTEAVTYISGRADPLMGLFLLAAFLVYIKYRTSNNRKFYLGSVVLFSLGLLSKELAIIFPCTILFYELYILKTEKRPFRFGLLNVTAFFIISLAYILIRLHFIKGNFMNTGFSLSQRILIAVTNFPVYLKMLFIPYTLHMGRNIVLFKWSDFLQTRVLFSVLSFIFIMLSMPRLYKKRNFFILFWMSWFFIFLLPQSGIFPINAFIAEHFIYLSSIGFFAVLIYFLIKLPRSFWIIITLILLLYYSYMTIERNLEWKDQLKFYETMVKRSPYSFVGYNNLGLVYEKQKLYDKAKAAFEQATRIEPGFIEARINRARIFYKSGEFKEAINQCSMVIKKNPNFLYGRTVLASIYADEEMYDKAIAEFDTAIKIFPSDPGIYNNLGLIYRQMQDYESAIQQFQEAIALDKKNEDFYNNLGVVYKDKGLYQLAIANYVKAFKINKNLAQTYSNLGVVYGILQRFNEAESEFKYAIKLKPDYVEAYFNLGALYWQQGRPEEAKINWQKVLTLEPGHKLAKEWMNK